MLIIITISINISTSCYWIFVCIIVHILFLDIWLCFENKKLLIYSCAEKDKVKCVIHCYKAKEFHEKKKKLVLGKFVPGSVTQILKDSRVFLAWFCFTIIVFFILFVLRH